MKRYPVILLLIYAIILSGCREDYKPNIVDISVSPEEGGVETVFSLRVEAVDEDGEILKYRWMAEEGRFIDPVNQAETRWMPPQVERNKTFKIKVNITDGENQVTKDISVSVFGADNSLGSLAAHFYYKGTKIGVSDVVVTLNNQKRGTNKAGAVDFEDVKIGTYHLNAWKAEFDAVNKDIRIESRVVTTELIEMTSERFTIKVSGHVLHKYTKAPFEGYEIFVINPDNTCSDIKSLINAEGYYELLKVPSYVDVTIAVIKTTDTIHRSSSRYSNVDITKDFEISSQFEFTDERDGNTYLASDINEKVWMLENLRYLPEVKPPNKGSLIDPYYYVYGNESMEPSEARANKNYSSYGVLYNYPAALSACPEGWHLSTDAEWIDLERYIGMRSDYLGQSGWRFGLWNRVDIVLKSQSGWYQDQNGTDDYALNVLPAGFRRSFKGFEGLRKYTYFWTEDNYDEDRAWSRCLGYANGGIERYFSPKNSGFSLRCLMDAQ